MLIRPAVLALAALALVPASASAIRVKFFHTPSGGIRCVFAKVEGHKSLRCDVLNATSPPAHKPPGCHFDWGYSYGLNQRGHARVLCISDALNKGSVLPYGSSIKRYGMRCRSRTTGLTCHNRSGHGFRLSREAQKRF